MTNQQPEIHPHIEADATTADRPPRFGRWSRWCIRVVVLGMLAVGGWFGLQFLTAWPTPDTIEELLPADTLFYARLRGGDTIAEAMRELHYGRALAGLDAQGRPLADVEPLAGDDEDSLKDERDRRTEVRRGLDMMRRFFKGDVAAALLPTDDPDEAVWLIVADVPGPVAEGLLAFAQSLLWFSRTSQVAEHHGATIRSYLDKDDPIESIHLVRLGDMVVMLSGTARRGPLEFLIDRYLGQRSDSLSRQIAEARAAMDWSSDEPEAPGLLLFVRGSELARYSLPRAQRFLARDEPGDAADALEMAETFGAYTTLLVELMPDDRGTTLEARGIPAPGLYPMLTGRSIPPTAAEAPRAVDDAAAALVLVARDAAWARTWFEVFVDDADARARRAADDSREQRRLATSQRVAALMAGDARPATLPGFTLQSSHSGQLVIETPGMLAGPFHPAFPARLTAEEWNGGWRFTLQGADGEPSSDATPASHLAVQGAELPDSLRETVFWHLRLSARPLQHFAADGMLAVMAEHSGRAPAARRWHRALSLLFDIDHLEAWAGFDASLGIDRAFIRAEAAISPPSSRP